MAELKTTKNRASVSAFLKSVEDEARRKDSKEVLEMMRAITGERPAMWGSSIVGFGQYRYTYASGREGIWMLTGFSPRKQALAVYIMAGLKRYPALMKELGKVKTGSSCLYLRRLDDVDRKVLHALITASVRDLKRMHR
jgi:hypothetical protein